MLINPGVGFTPTIALHIAGTRPDPAVSVASAKLHSPAATATAEPEDDPPAMKRGLRGFIGGGEDGHRVPTRPQANWSMTVLPMQIAPEHGAGGQ